MEFLRIVHLSDLHFRRHYENYGFQQLLGQLPDSLSFLKDCLKQEKKQGIDLVLFTGDLCHEGSKEDYTLLRDTLNEVLDGIPWVVLPGNHDALDNFEAVFHVSSEQAVYNVNGWRVITLNTGTGIAGTISASQNEWLRAVLSFPSQKGSILALHHPMVPNQENLGTMKMDGGLPACIAESDVTGIFCGHTHHNYTGLFAGKPYFTADSFSYIIEESGCETVLKSFAAYNRIELSKDYFSMQVRQLAPASAVVARFSTDKLSTLLKKESEEKHEKILH